jgi:hypothetical protein
MDDELGRAWKGAVVVSSRHYSVICSMELRNAKKNSQDDRRPCRDSNRASPEHEVITEVNMHVMSVFLIFKKYM